MRGWQTDALRRSAHPAPQVEFHHFRGRVPAQVGEAGSVAALASSHTRQRLIQMTQVDDVEILLVEDNPADVELTLRALKKNNLANKVVVVNDGVEALDFLYARNAYAHRNAADRPRLILLDLKLPKLSGIEVARAIKNDERLKTIPVVMLTSSAEERDIVESYRIGVNSYMVKPVEFDKFVTMVSDLGFYWMILNKIVRG